MGEASNPAAEDAGARVDQALTAAYRYLNRRERTTTEVRRRLEHDGFSAATIAQAMAVLHEQGSLDDQRFARLFAQDKRELEQWGSERIRRALIQRGVDAETVAMVLDGGGDFTAAMCESEAERALSLLRRRFPSPPRSRRDRDRALGVLLRKGYEFELAVELLSAYGHE